ncbi:MAG: maleylpyruvate isomerase family mycothiol-dependent enzyme [Reyranella sp.]|uniref:maleylpyruvate isomerase family mycothiol-dependent enzyme n=1 Tax=Reyranella sp. TaxID=1929291 RepID=UPI003D0F7CAE
MGLGGPELLEQWRETLDRLSAALAAKPSDARLPWAGPDMGVATFTTARQMEIWAHGQAIYDLLGVERPAPAPRLRNIAELGVRTFGWAYRNRGLPVPAVRPFIELATPFGERWAWNTPSVDEAVTGDAFAFCQVVTQTRNAADTGLRISGSTARHWMTIAQCFAGPPETPPAPRSRYRGGSAPTRS